MTVPDYIISRTIAAEHEANQLRNRRDCDVPKPRPRRPKTTDRLTGIRRQLGTALHAIASRIDREPAGSR